MKVGIIGSGFIGTAVASALARGVVPHAELVGLASRKKPLGNLGYQWIPLDDVMDLKVDLLIEAAHPDLIRDQGCLWLHHADLLPLSLSAFAERGIEAQLRASASQNNRRIIIPAGAVVGFDTLIAHRDQLEEITISTVKPPSALIGSTIQESFEGTVREACKRFPRNVNSHAAVALATLGFDRVQSKVCIDPRQTGVLQIIHAQGANVSFELRRTAALQGVSGITMIASVLQSLRRLLPQEGVMTFC